MSAPQVGAAPATYTLTRSSNGDAMDDLHTCTLCGDPADGDEWCHDCALTIELEIDECIVTEIKVPV